MLLSACLGQPVRLDARRVGRVADLGVAPGVADEPVVTGVVVARRGRSPAWAPWSTVAELGPSGATLRTEVLGAVPDGILLARDVLDAQLLDLAGRRVVRVGDVDLRAAGSDVVLSGVEAGLDSVAARLGLHRLAAHLAPGTIPWREVHLPADPGATLTIDRARTALARLSPEEHRRLAERLPTPVATGLLRVPRGRLRHRFPTHVLRRRRARA